MMKKINSITLLKNASRCIFLAALVAAFIAPVTLADTTQGECDKVLICHKPDNTTIIVVDGEEVTVGINGKTMCKDDNSLETHMSHGDTYGACVSSPTS